MSNQSEISPSSTHLTQIYLLFAKTPGACPEYNRRVSPGVVYIL